MIHLKLHEPINFLYFNINDACQKEHNGGCITPLENLLSVYNISLKWEVYHSPEKVK
jgi:hypothetical protein